MSCYQVDPLIDARWDCLVKRHPLASVFHSRAWLQALRQSYGYDPVVFTTSPPNEELKNGILFCHVSSWFTGSRLVSLPFSDHCQPLCDSQEDLIEILNFLQKKLGDEKWKYVELRPAADDLSHLNGGMKFRPSSHYQLHKLYLNHSLDELFKSFHKDSVQRRIQRAVRAGLIEKCGTSDSLLRDFYSMFVMTRGRHCLPPNPITWFENLRACAGEAMELRVAYKGGIPIASILTLRFKDVLYYKYGCSNARYNRYGAMPWLFWRAIESAKNTQATQFDLGRTEEDGSGLLTFKNHWAQPEPLVYWQYPLTAARNPSASLKIRLAKRIFCYLPDKVLVAIGKLAYRHVG